MCEMSNGAIAIDIVYIKVQFSFLNFIHYEYSLSSLGCSYSVMGCDLNCYNATDGSFQVTELTLTLPLLDPSVRKVPKPWRHT